MMYRQIFVWMILMALLIGCSGSQEETAGKPQADNRVVVQTQLVDEVDFPIILRLGGSLRGAQQSSILGKVSTTVTRIPVKVGQVVAKGDLLIMLDPGGVQSQYNQAEAVFLNAESQVTKMRTLFEAGAISETQRDAAETAYEVAKANFHAASQSIKITAPFDGIITGINMREGDEVNPGQPLITVADRTSLRLLLDVSADQAHQLKAGQPVRVVSPVDSSVVMNGKVYSVADAADQATRSFEVECRFASPSDIFAPGMYVTAEIETKILPSALVVPSEALLYRSGKAMVYVVDNDTAKTVAVTALASADGKTAITGDIEYGQRIVVVGHKNLTPGTPVREDSR